MSTEGFFTLTNCAKCEASVKPNICTENSAASSVCSATHSDIPASASSPCCRATREEDCHVHQTTASQKQPHRYVVFRFENLMSCGIKVCRRRDSPLIWTDGKHCRIAVQSCWIYYRTRKAALVDGLDIVKHKGGSAVKMHLCPNKELSPTSGEGWG